MLVSRPFSGHRSLEFGTTLTNSGNSIKAAHAHQSTSLSPIAPADAHGPADSFAPSSVDRSPELRLYSISPQSNSQHAYSQWLTSSELSTSSGENSLHSSNASLSAPPSDASSHDGSAADLAADRLPIYRFIDFLDAHRNLQSLEPQPGMQGRFLTIPSARLSLESHQDPRWRRRPPILDSSLPFLPFANLSDSNNLERIYSPANEDVGKSPQSLKSSPRSSFSSTRPKLGRSPSQSSEDLGKGSESLKFSTNSSLSSVSPKLERSPFRSTEDLGESSESLKSSTSSTRSTGEAENPIRRRLARRPIFSQPTFSTHSLLLFVPPAK